MQKTHTVLKEKFLKILLESLGSGSGDLLHNLLVGM